MAFKRVHSPIDRELNWVSGHGRPLVVVLWCLFFCLQLLCPALAAALNGTLTFDPSPSSQVTGYKVYYGTTSRSYDHTLDIGNATQCQITGLEPDTTYYFAATAYDAYGNESDYSEELTVSTATANSPPSPVDDTASTPEDTSVDISVLENDTDDDGDALQITDVSAPSHGQADIFDNLVRYTPDQDYSGSDSFTYTVSDGNNGTASAHVDVTVSAVNDPPLAADDTASVSEDASVDISVLANDSDPDGDPLSITGVTAPANGQAEIKDTMITYIPKQDYHGSDTFAYTVDDGRGGTATAEVGVSISPVNDPPQAGDVSASTSENTAVDIPVLNNDVDIDGDALTVASVTQPEHGTAQVSDTQVTYTPDQDFHGNDSCTYTVSDGHGGYDSAEISIFVKKGVLPPGKPKMKYK